MTRTYSSRTIAASTVMGTQGKYQSTRCFHHIDQAWIQLWLMQSAARTDEQIVVMKYLLLKVLVISLVQLTLDYMPVLLVKIINLIHPSQMSIAKT